MKAGQGRPVPGGCGAAAWCGLQRSAGGLHSSGGCWLRGSQQHHTSTAGRQSAAAAAAERATRPRSRPPPRPPRPCMCAAAARPARPRRPRFLTCTRSHAAPAQPTDASSNLLPKVLLYNLLCLWIARRPPRDRLLHVLIQVLGPAAALQRRAPRPRALRCAAAEHCMILCAARCTLHAGRALGRAVPLHCMLRRACR